MTTPQNKGRYGDYDVLAEADHWDALTRSVVVDRVGNVPSFRFFEPDEVETLTALCDVLTAQDSEPRIPVLAYIDEKLHNGEGEGHQYFDMPSDGDVWRSVARGLGEVAFAKLGIRRQLDLCELFSKSELFGGAWATLNVSRAWSIVVRDVCDAFYAHPWAWNEIGFGGPAYPRGYAVFGSPELGEEEHWEAKEQDEE